MASIPWKICSCSLPEWGQALAIDLNGDGFVDIRDFLYINVSDE